MGAGVKLAEKAFSLNEFSAAGWYYSVAFYDAYLKGDYEMALEYVSAHPNWRLSENLQKFVMVYGRLGNTEKAQQYWNMILDQEQEWSAELLDSLYRLWNFRDEDRITFMEGIYAAGIPRPDVTTN
jgi:hypothetical protein